jgi:hypothetical protein
MRKLLALTFILVAALLVAVGLASAHGPQGNYAQGWNGIGGRWGTPGLNHRHYNQVWHAEGYTWAVYWVLSDGSSEWGFVANVQNPTRWPNEAGYVRAFCENFGDNSNVMWTCQTTGADVG